MTIPASIIFFSILILGLVWGSFLNVVIHRFRTGRSIVRGRSQCDACARTLRWYELLPVVSWAIQRGRCRRCQTKLSWQYPAVEAATTLAVVVSYQQLGISWIFLTAIFVISLTIVISVYDWRHMIIPDPLVWCLLVFGGGAVLISALTDISLVPAVNSFWQHILGAVLVPLPFFLIWLFSKGRLMGFGDVKLMVPMGLILGLNLAASAVILAFWLGTLVVLVMLASSLVFQRKKSGATAWWRKEIPFGPYLCIAFWLVLVFQVTIVDILIWIW